MSKYFTLFAWLPFIWSGGGELMSHGSQNAVAVQDLRTGNGKSNHRGRREHGGIGV
ncbi:hypothetical protein [Nostoc sp.]|uniref:hypothetical protein n=1 Tax=Nostoc sp. TaxID=1180 RepID=UPI002FF6A7B5